MQKNTLLTLCSDRILQDVQFDKYRCARLVLSCLCNFDDPSMNRMSVAICSILAAKICTNETHLLGAQPMFMRKLLEIVRGKVEAQSLDITIKFTLSALWNLTGKYYVGICEFASPKMEELMYVVLFFQMNLPLRVKFFWKKGGWIYFYRS